MVQSSQYPKDMKHTLAAFGAAQPPPAVVDENQEYADAIAVMRDQFAMMRQFVTKAFAPAKLLQNKLESQKKMMDEMNGKLAVLCSDVTRRYNIECWNSNVHCNEDWKGIMWPHNPANQIPKGLPQTLGQLNAASNPILDDIIGTYELTVNLAGTTRSRRREVKLRAVKERLKIPV
jgi:hypothetical protein